MNLALIRTFLAIIETGSLVKASRYLNITQSTVTSRLKTLEDEVGQPLVHRQKSGVSLTASGIKLRHYAEAIHNMWQQALLETSMPAGMKVVCNLGCEPCLWPTLGRKLVQSIRSTHPTTALTIKQGNRQQLESWLSAGLIEASVTYKASTSSGFTSEIVGIETLAVFSTTQDGPIYHDPNYTYYDAGADFGRGHAAAYNDADVAKNSFDNAVWCLEHLLDCGGSAYLPEKLAQPYVDQQILFRLEKGAVFSRDIFLTTNDIAIGGWPWLTNLVVETAS